MQEETTNPDYKKPQMQIFVKDGDQTVFQFPILPPSISVTVEGKHNAVNVQTRGDVTIIGKKGLKTVEFTSFFPLQSTLVPLIRKYFPIVIMIARQLYIPLWFH